MTDRPDPIALACEAGGHDRRSFEAGYRLRTIATLIGDTAGARGAAQITVPPDLVPSIEAFAASIGATVSLPDPDHDTPEACLVLIDATE
ncbi:MAG: hypothetical protein U5R31_03165 [Acidimicrobiia bacterium]|nr:hypothetical protein [Acidimicrobiia bacterium]